MGKSKDDSWLIGAETWWLFLQTWPRCVQSPGMPRRPKGRGMALPLSLNPRLTCPLCLLEVFPERVSNHFGYHQDLFSKPLNIEFHFSVKEFNCFQLYHLTPAAGVRAWKIKVCRDINYLRKSIWTWDRIKPKFKSMRSKLSILPAHTSCLTKM